MAEVRLLHGAISVLESMSLRTGRTSTWILLVTWHEARQQCLEYGYHLQRFYIIVLSFAITSRSSYDKREIHDILYIDFLASSDRVWLTYKGVSVAIQDFEPYNMQSAYLVKLQLGRWIIFHGQVTSVPNVEKVDTCSQVVLESERCGGKCSW